MANCKSNNCDNFASCADLRKSAREQEKRKQRQVVALLSLPQQLSAAKKRKQESPAEVRFLKLYSFAAYALRATPHNSGNNNKQQCNTEALRKKRSRKRSSNSRELPVATLQCFVTASFCRSASLFCRCFADKDLLVASKAANRGQKKNAAKNPKTAQQFAVAVLSIWY